MMPDSDLPDVSAEAFREVCSRTILTIDGLWFLAVEKAFGFEVAFKLNQEVWSRCSFIHGRRLLNRLNLDTKPPLERLLALLLADPLVSVHQGKVTARTETRLVLSCMDCPVQTARIRDGRGVFHGKPGCTLLFEAYAKLVDPRIETTCLSCAPNPENPEYWCEWEFKISGQEQ